MSDDQGPVLQLRAGAVIPRAALRMSAVTASGPGGQHVNRSNTAVELRIAVADLPLDPDQRALLEQRLANRITGSGELRVEASASRSQLRNRRTAEQRLVELVDEAIVPETERTTTRPSRRARARARDERERAQRLAAERRWSPGSND
ncbi:MAG: ribosome-associated protein [Gaiellales bacterium]|jgi:ribosome-associated protein|nr:ribosome-associated protein [Gaiellales bacterium]